ncbi:MAG: hypothetical protein H6625_03040 [Bdellovibrionaceae bacterium]|nr:hypothetical protein [Pseudobdellovibrionaceae bacterium]
MAFDYDKIKERQDSQTYWATSSDLFMVLSLVFLLLYVVAGLKSSTYTIQKNKEYKRVMELNADLKEQLKVYNTVQKDYLEKQASNDEVEVYKNLMGKLNLLQEDAKNEKNNLRAQAKENEKKEQALNQYQQLIRNIINSNMMAKTTIERRDKQIKEVKTESESKIAELESKFKDVADNLKKTKSNLAAKERKLANANRKKEMLVNELQKTQSQFESELKELKENQKKQAEAERREYKEKIQKQKMSAKARERALKQFQEEQKAKYNKEVASLSKKVEKNQKELKKAKSRLNARKALAAKIKSNFNKAGIDAEVDGDTGDVVINFGDEYFDTGKFSLKPNMKNILEKSIPVYAKSLFSDKKISEKLSYIEVVGFASPTYKGKYIDPQSMDENDRKAIQYNLDLSYKRARSIFDNIFDTSSLTFPEQKRLKSLVKVTGRSFLAEKVDASTRGIASGMDQKEFCKIYDCKKAQRVIIKFDLEN